MQGAMGLATMSLRSILYNFKQPLTRERMSQDAISYILKMALLPKPVPVQPKVYRYAELGSAAREPGQVSSNPLVSILAML